MFREIKNLVKKLTDEEMAEILEKAEYGIMSTIGEDGYPYGVPVNFVYDKGCIYFHCALEGHKLDNIAFNKKVSFCAVTDVEVLPKEFNTKYKSVIAFGEVEELTGEAKKEAFMRIIQRFSMEYRDSGEKYVDNSGHKAKMFKIKIEHMTAKGKK